MKPKTLKILLVVSILLNIFLLSAVIAGTICLRARHSMLSAGSLRIAGDELPAAERHAFRLSLRETRRQAFPLVHASRQARQDAAALLVQPSVDQVALAVALSRIRAADIALRGRIEDHAITFVATLPQTDRARLARGLLRRPDQQARQPAR